MDAFTHKHRSFRGMFYADIFRDLATQMVYTVYTKDRTGEELITQMGKELDKHPEWCSCTRYVPYSLAHTVTYLVRV